MNLEIRHNLAELVAAMRRYAALSGRALDDVIERYGRDLGIKLFQGFSARRWGGGARGRTIAEAELAQRTQAGRGTLIRPAIRARYESERAAFSTSLRSVGQRLRHAKRRGTLDQIAGKLAERAHLRALRSNLWRRTVGAEIAARARGIGVLAASFLWYRKRSNNARGTFIVPNRTGQPLGSVEKTEDGGLTIRGFTEGLDVIDARYGIVAEAIAARLEDTREHMRSRYLGIAQEAGLVSA